jgi:hypothetical protein
VVDTVKIYRPEFEFAEQADNPSGHVGRDDRGNAVWQWAGREAASPVNLEMPTLSLADEEPPTPLGNARLNTVATKAGYNPYESGLILKKDRPRRRDLRQLSRWIEQQKKRGAAEDA